MVEGFHKGIDGAVAHPLDFSGLAVHSDGSKNLNVSLFLSFVVDFEVFQFERAVQIDEVLVKGLLDFRRAQFPTLLIRNGIDFRSHLGVHGFGKVKTEFTVKNVGHASFAALAIDADNGFVTTPDILRVDGKVRDCPRSFRCIFQFFRACRSPF